MKFESLHLNQDLIKGVKFHPQRMCSCGCNTPMVFCKEGGTSEEIIADMVSNMERALCLLTVGVLRKANKETIIVMSTDEDGYYKVCKLGKQTVRQLGKEVEDIIRCGAEYIVLAEEVEKGVVRVISNEEIMERVDI